MKKTIKQIVPMLLLFSIVAVSGCKKEALSVSGSTWIVNANFSSGVHLGTNIYFNANKSVTSTAGVGQTWSQSGSDVTFSIAGNTTQGASTIVTFNGHLNGVSMSGTMSNSYGDAGTFSATK